MDNKMPQHNCNLPEYNQNYSIIKNEKKPYRCPVCYGRGIVSAGFYNSTENIWVTSTTVPESCRSCNGTGVVWND